MDDDLSHRWWQDGLNHDLAVVDLEVFAQFPTADEEREFREMELDVSECSVNFEPDSPERRYVSPPGSVYTNSEVDDDAYGEELDMFKSIYPSHEDKRRAVHEDYGFDDSIMVVPDGEDDFFIAPSETSLADLSSFL